MDRELNLLLTAKEAGYVQAALVNMRNNIEYYNTLNMMKRGINYDPKECEKTIKEIAVIIEKVERMTDG